MAKSNDPLLESALDLAWSHWTGIGVRGVVPPPDTAVDPEALVYLTAVLGEYDTRLREEAGDWWARFQTFVSRPRLTTLAKRFDEAVVASFQTFEAHYLSARETTGKSRVDRLDHPARALLRLRLVFGANARAEMILALLTQWRDQGATALALSEVGYSKRNIAEILDALAMAGMLIATHEGNRIRYRVRDPDMCRSLFGPIPERPGRWDVRMPLIAGFIQLSERLRGKSPTIQAVEARKFLEGFQRELQALDLAAPQHVPAETYWREVRDWAIRDLVAAPGRSTKAIVHMIEGAWIGPTGEISRPNRFTNAVLPVITTANHPSAEMICLDLVQAPTVEPPGDWTWVVLSDAVSNVHAHQDGLRRGEPWRFLTSEGRIYTAGIAKAIPADQIAKRYGRAAVQRARDDCPAFQIKLTPSPP